MNKEEVERIVLETIKNLTVVVKVGTGYVDNEKIVNAVTVQLRLGDRLISIDNDFA